MVALSSNLAMNTKVKKKKCPIQTHFLPQQSKTQITERQLLLALPFLPGQGGPTAATQG